MIDSIAGLLVLLALFLVCSAVIMLCIYWCHCPAERRKKCRAKR